MARTTPRPTPTVPQTLLPMAHHCPCCGAPMWAASHNDRTRTTLEAVLRLPLQRRRGLNGNCPQLRTPYRPEAEGRLALPTHACGLDVLACVGPPRSAQHRSIPAIPHALVDQGVAVAQRTVTTLLERYEAWLSLTLQDPARLRRLTQPHGRVIVALEGLQPDVGHAVLWGIRDGLSGDVLLARSWLSASSSALTARLLRVQQALRVPRVAVVSDGQRSIRKAVPDAWPTVPHHLGHLHS
jgi:hypothetical protein